MASSSCSGERPAPSTRPGSCARRLGTSRRARGSATPPSARRPRKQACSSRPMRCGRHGGVPLRAGPPGPHRLVLRRRARLERRANQPGACQALRAGLDRSRRPPRKTLSPTPGPGCAPGKPRVSRYHAAGYLTHADRDALQWLLARCDQAGEIANCRIARCGPAGLRCWAPPGCGPVTGSTQQPGRGGRDARLPGPPRHPPDHPRRHLHSLLCSLSQPSGSGQGFQNVTACQVSPPLSVSSSCPGMSP